MISYRFYLTFGYKIPIKNFDHFLIKIPEKFHLEKRFDSKTGKEIEPEKIIDETEESFYSFNGKYFESYDYDQVEEFISLLANSDFQKENQLYKVFYLKNTVHIYIPLNNTKELNSMIFASGSTSKKEIDEKYIKLIELKSTLSKYKIEIGEPEIYNMEVID